MRKKALRLLRYIAWTLGFIALALLAYGIIRTLI